MNVMVQYFTKPTNRRIFNGLCVCLKCGKLYMNDKFFDWCDICSVKYVRGNSCTRSGNARIDDFIKEKQQKANHTLRNFSSGYLSISLKMFPIVLLYGKVQYILTMYNKENNEIFRRGELTFKRL